MYQIIHSKSQSADVMVTLTSVSGCRIKGLECFNFRVGSKSLELKFIHWHSVEVKRKD